MLLQKKRDSNKKKSAVGDHNKTKWTFLNRASKL